MQTDAFERHLKILGAGVNRQVGEVQHLAREHFEVTQVEEAKVKRADRKAAKVDVATRAAYRRQQKLSKELRKKMDIDEREAQARRIGLARSAHVPVEERKTRDEAVDLSQKYSYLGANSVVIG